MYYTNECKELHAKKKKTGDKDTGNLCTHNLKEWDSELEWSLLGSTRAICDITFRIGGMHFCGYPFGFCSELERWMLLAVASYDVYKLMLDLFCQDLLSEIGNSF